MSSLRTLRIGVFWSFFVLETLEPSNSNDEVRFLARFVSGQLCLDERKKRDWKTTDQKIDIFIRVKKEQLKLKQSSTSNVYEIAIKNIADQENMGIKVIEGYCTNVADLLQGMIKISPNILDKKIRQAIELYCLFNKKDE